MNAEQFKEKLLPVSQKLYRFAYRFLENVQESEDVVQEVFVKLWNMRDQLGEIKNHEAFATTITKNLCLDKIKAKKTVSMDDKEYGLQAQLTENTNPYQELEAENNQLMIKKIVDSLPDQQRTIMMMRDFEEYSFQEMEELTGLNLNYIRVNLSRARKQVRDEFIKLQQYGTHRNKETSGKIL
jgi:RNA polymerase sigma factor (sigma-70 family)